jgi:hypothetical protein
MHYYRNVFIFQNAKQTFKQTLTATTLIALEKLVATEVFLNIELTNLNINKIKY